MGIISFSSLGWVVSSGREQESMCITVSLRAVRDIGLREQRDKGSPSFKYGTGAVGLRFN